MTDSSLTIQVEKRENLSAKEQEDILTLCSAGYKTDFRPYMEYLTGITHVTGYLDGIPVSHACWVTRWLQADDNPPMRTAYVEAVVTHPDHQGKGYASAVMTRLGKEISGFTLGALCTGYVDFYSRFGWKVWPGPLFIRTDTGLLPTPDEIVMVLLLPGSPELDIHASLSAEWREGEVW